jgi:hypothetical protein
MRKTAWGCRKAAFKPGIVKAAQSAPTQASGAAAKEGGEGDGEQEERRGLAGEGDEDDSDDENKEVRRLALPL